jgi:hypothetical protein
VRQELHVILCSLLPAATVSRREGWLAPIYFQQHTLLRPCSMVASFPQRRKLFERANFNQQSDESKSSTARIFHNAQPRRQTKEKVHFSFFLPTGSDGDAAAKRHRGRESRAESSRMKNHVAKFTLLVGCVKNGLFAHA